MTIMNTVAEVVGWIVLGGLAFVGLCTVISRLIGP